MARCMLCDIDVNAEDWDAHQNSEMHKIKEANFFNDSEESINLIQNKFSYKHSRLEAIDTFNLLKKQYKES